MKLARGGFDQVEQIFRPAGQIYHEAEARDDQGNILRDNGGRPIIRKLAIYNIETLPPDPNNPAVESTAPAAAPKQG